MKTILLNAGPRKNWNTAQLLKEVQRGAKSVGTETEYIDLYDLEFTGCRSCLACKRKGIAEPCRCYWKDEFSQLIERIYQADRLVLGSPVYFGEPTGVFRQALERICFPAISYEDYSSRFGGRVDVDVFLTMNVDEDFFTRNYSEKLQDYLSPFYLLNGEVKLYSVCDTLQVDDYGKYDMGGFSEAHKKERHASQFPADLADAFRIGMKTR